MSASWSSSDRKEVQIVLVGACSIMALTLFGRIYVRLDSVFATEAYAE
jgi:hypothetical protein